MKVLALSGPSCSGKTTLAKHLQTILPDAKIIYEDDFYVPDSQIPKTNGLDNWDCPAAFDLVKMAETLHHAKQTGQLPEKYDSIEAKNDLKQSLATEHTVESLKNRLKSFTETVVIVDGIMLYQRGSPVLGELDLKVLITGDYKVLKERREARKGYVTIEGFWTDPPGYFDKIVWPEYTKNYGYLFKPDGTLSPAARHAGIIAPPTKDLDELLVWLVEKIIA